MPDNWNKLADLLGTPSINPIERKPSTPRTPTRPKDTTSTKASSHQEAEPPAGSIDEPVEASERIEEPVAAVPQIAPEPKSKFKSTWDAVADFFGVGTPEKEEPVAPASQPTKSGKTSMWQSDEDDDEDSRSRRASQKASDELLGLKGPSSSEDPDLDALLSGFRTPPQPQASVQVPAEREIERVPREPRRRDEPSQRSRRPEPRGRDLPRETEPQQESRSRPEPRHRSASRTTEPVEHLEERGRTPERRGERRPSRRTASDSVESPPRENVDIGTGEDSTIDRPRRGQRRSSSDRHRRSETVRNEVEFAPAPEIRRPKTSAWDDPTLADRSASDDSEFGSDVRSQESNDGEGARRRRRRRRPSSRDSESVDAGDDAMASTGRQIYGRHSDEGEEDEGEVEQLRTSVVVPWVDAISGLIEKNMKNHRSPPSGGPRGRGGERRR